MNTGSTPWGITTIRSGGTPNQSAISALAASEPEMTTRARRASRGITTAAYDRYHGRKLGANRMGMTSCTVTTVGNVPVTGPSPAGRCSSAAPRRRAATTAPAWCHHRSRIAVLNCSRAVRFARRGGCAKRLATRTSRSPSSGSRAATRFRMYTPIPICTSRP